MCGIAGFLGNYDEARLGQMAARIARRGPDDEGFFHDPEAQVGLAHRRLSILDLSSAGHQPMTDQSGRFTLCYNGEIYNFPELRDELVSAGVSFRGSSDTEVILELLARRGLDQLARLNGIFAFALWDRQTRTLHLVRDGLGVKPLYWTRTPSGFAFASEIKALTVLPDLSREIDPVAAVAYLSYLYSPGERTMFEAVRKLEPGTIMSLSLREPPRSAIFWELPAPDPRPMSPEEAVAGMRHNLGAAVERQMISDVEVGSFLSGGLDSSAIVSFAREHASDGKLPCFTIDYSADAAAERELVSDLPYARATARHLGVDLHEVRVDASMADDLQDLVAMLDEPQADPAALNNYYISRLARQSGIKVLLSGAGGDDLLTGYRRHRVARLDRFIGVAPAFARSTTAFAARKLPQASPGLRKIRKGLENIGRSPVDRIVGLFEWLSPDVSARLLSSAEGAALATAAREPMVRAASDSALLDGVDRALRLDQKFFLTDHNLNYTDKTGMAAGVEIRVPFLDHELVQWASRVPTDLKMRHRQTKWPLRKAMEGILPAEVLDRPKTGFGVPLRSWMDGGLRPMLDDVLSGTSIRERGLFDEARISRLREDNRLGRIDASYTILAAAMIELWCREFVDRT